jgi:hypothetical protein
MPLGMMKTAARPMEIKREAAGLLRMRETAISMSQSKGLTAIPMPLMDIRGDISLASGNKPCYSHVGVDAGANYM